MPQPDLAAADRLAPSLLMSPGDARATPVPVVHRSAWSEKQAREFVMCRPNGESPDTIESRQWMRRVKRYMRRLVTRPAAGSVQGFTLIELANVIMIVSVLTVIGLPTMTDSHATVKRTSCCERQRHVFEAGLLYGAEHFVADGEVNVSVLIPDYVLDNVGECPESVSRDFDDYTIIFQDGQPVDVICDIEGAEHPWAPR